MDNLVISLCKFSTWNTFSEGTFSVIEFGNSERSMLATETLFLIVNSHSSCVRQAWGNVLACIIAFNSFDLLPNLGSGPDFSDSLKQEGTKKKRTEPKQSTSLLSYLFGSSLMTSSGDGVPTKSTPSLEELKAMDNAREIADKCCIDSLIDDSKVLHPTSLRYLIKSLLVGCSPPPNSFSDTTTISDATSSTENSTNDSGQNAVDLDDTLEVNSLHRVSSVADGDEKAALFCMHLLYRVVKVNSFRISESWTYVNSYFALLFGLDSCSAIVRRGIVTLFELSFFLLSVEDMQTRISQTLLLLAEASQKVFENYAEIIAYGCQKLIHCHSPVLHDNPVGRKSVFFLLKRCAGFRLAASRGLEGISNFMSTCLKNEPLVGSYALVGDSSESSHFFSLAINALQHYSIHMENPDLKLKVLELMASLFHSSVFACSENESRLEKMQMESMWLHSWKPILKCLCVVSLDPSQIVRNHAMTHLQRALLAPHLAILTSIEWLRCIEEILFPLLGDVLKPAAEYFPEMDMDGLDETRLRATVVLSKVFLQHLPVISKHEAFSALWTRMLEYFGKCMKVDESELLAESVPELLKNILLVMIAWGHFKPDNPEIWQPTWTFISNSCPQLKEDVASSTGIDVSSVISTVNENMNKNIIESDNKTNENENDENENDENENESKDDIPEDVLCSKMVNGQDIDDDKKDIENTGLNKTEEDIVESIPLM